MSSLVAEVKAQLAQGAGSAEKARFAYADALPIAQKFVTFLQRHCTRIAIAGSLRREKQLVSDIEILFISKRIAQPDPNDMFGGTIQVDAAAVAINSLLLTGIVAKRAGKNGGFTWGAENKLGLHVASGIPVDFFATTEERWWNALVVRTGPAALNRQIASLALQRGWNWHAYGDGFTRGREAKRVRGEQEVFEHVGLQYLEPKDR